MILTNEGATEIEGINPVYAVYDRNNQKLKLVPFP